MGRVRRLWQQALVVVRQDAGGVAIINLVLAVVAFGKDLLQAVYFGTSPSADALTLAFFIPDTIGNNLMASAIGVACVPLFCKLLVQGETRRLRRLFGQVTLAVAVLAGLCCLLMYLFRDQVVNLLGSGLQPDVFAQVVQLLMILLPSIVLFPVCMIGSAALQAMGMYRPPAWAPVVFNSFYLGAVALLLVLHVDQQQGALYTAVGILAGVVGMTVLVGVALLQKGGRAWLQARSQQEAHGGTEVLEKRDDLRRVMRSFAPYLLILGSSQLVYAVERHVASLQGSGTIAGLNYAFRLAQFPNWVFVAALTTVMLPSLSRALEQRDHPHVQAAWQRGVKSALVLTVPISLGLCLLRVPLVALLFRHGSFDQHSLQTTANILAGYSLAIVAQALVAVGLRYYMAVERMRVPMVISIAMMAVNTGFDVWMAPLLGPTALGAGAAIGAWVGAVVMLLCVSGDLRKMGKLGAAHGAISYHHSGS